MTALSSDLLFTSPYLVYHRNNFGRLEVLNLMGARSLAATRELQELLTMFATGHSLSKANSDLAGCKVRSDLLFRAINYHFLVNDLATHRSEVYEDFERRIDPDRPKIGYIETTSRCPFVCMMCPKSTPSYVRPDETMSMALFERIISQLKFQRSVTLHLFGDPLMDPMIFERISLMSDYNLRASFSTNAMLLNESFHNKLLQSKIRKLVISVDAVTTETYRFVRGANANLDLAKKRLRSFLIAWKLQGRPIRIVLRFVNLDANFLEQNAFLEAWKEFDGIEFDIKTHLRFPDVSPNLDQQTVNKPENRLFVLNQNGRAPVKCLRHWFSSKGELGVQVDGAVVPCCLSHTREVVLGDLSTERLESVWRSDRFRLLRRAIFFRDSLKDFPICERCNFDLN
jgi:MoaA/NifB/PqqE/SkfB family radical SAM enzyme